jgi:hypothetical protein
LIVWGFLCNAVVRIYFANSEIVEQVAVAAGGPFRLLPTLIGLPLVSIF